MASMMMMCPASAIPTKGTGMREGVKIRVQTGSKPGPAHKATPHR